LDEREIIKGCQQNNRKSQRIFVERYSKYLFGVCIRYVKNKFEAKDCLQDALVHILKNIDKYEERGLFKPWLAKVTSMICLQYIRRNKKFEYYELEEASGGFEDEVVSHGLAVAEIHRFLDSMPYNYRIAINMFLVEGYSHKEIAETLGISVSSSRSLVARGRKMIVAEFTEQELGDKKKELSYESWN